MNLAVRNLIRLVRLLTGAHFDGNHTISLSVALHGAIIDRQHQLVEGSVECLVLHGFRVPCVPLMIQKLIEPCPPGSAPMGYGAPCRVDGEAMREVDPVFKIATSQMCHGVATNGVETSCRSSCCISSLCEVCIFVFLLLCI